MIWGPCWPDSTAGAARTICSYMWFEFLIQAFHQKKNVTEAGLAPLHSNALIKNNRHVSNPILSMILPHLLSPPAPLRAPYYIYMRACELVPPRPRPVKKIQEITATAMYTTNCDRYGGPGNISPQVECASTPHISRPRTSGTP